MISFASTNIYITPPQMILVFFLFLKNVDQKPGPATPVLSLATSAAAYAIAAGTELTNGQAEVVIWQASPVRNMRDMTYGYSGIPGTFTLPESNTSKVIMMM